MNQEWKDRLSNLVGAAFWIGLLAIIFWPVIRPEPVITCATEPIYYETVREDSPDVDIGEDYVDVTGENGERELCVDEDGGVTSDTMTIEPVTEVVKVGTREPEPVYTPVYNTSYRTGAICSDNTYSSATGSGACSWHGGVSEWLYN